MEIIEDPTDVFAPTIFNSSFASGELDDTNGRIVSRKSKMIIRNVPCHANFNTGGRWSRRIVALFRAYIYHLQFNRFTLVRIFVSPFNRLKDRWKIDSIRSTFRRSGCGPVRADVPNYKTVATVYHWGLSKSVKKTVERNFTAARTNGRITCRIDSTGSLWNPFTFPVSRWWMLKYCQMMVFAPYTLSFDAISYILLVGTITCYVNLEGITRYR